MNTVSFLLSAAGAWIEQFQDYHRPENCKSAAHGSRKVPSTLPSPAFSNGQKGALVLRVRLVLFLEVSAITLN